MKKALAKLLSNQQGSALPTSLMLAAGVVLTTATITTLNKNLRKNRDQVDNITAERRLNETALQTVAQLSSNGLLHFNKDCGRVEPSQPNIEYRFNGCGQVTNTRASINCKGDASSANWLYSWNEGAKVATVDVCVRYGQRSGGKEASELRPIRVSFNSYEINKDDEGFERNYALVKSQPQGKNSRNEKFSALNGKISLGLVTGNTGLVGKHGAADTCFYMRPSTQAQTRGGGYNLAFKARKASGEYVWNELEPRPDGPNADEFQQKVDLSYPQTMESDYAVLDGFRREKLFPLFASGMRGSRPATTNWNVEYIPYKSSVLSKSQVPDVKSQGFIGVMPKVPNGPQFKYFLWASNDSGKLVHSQNFNKFDHRQEKGFEMGCATTTKRAGGNPKFCTKVELPFFGYTAQFNKRCVATTQKLEPVPAGQERRVVVSDRSIMTSCHPDWVKTVEGVIRRANRFNDGLQRAGGNDEADFSGEVTAEMAMSALEADEDFLNGTGSWAQDKKSKSDAYRQLKIAYNNLGTKFNQPGQAAVNKFTVRHTSDVCAGATCNAAEVNAKTRVFTIYTLEDAPRTERSHTSSTCAYFRYHDPMSPKGCKIDFITRDQNNWVCRNNDGCFDELTKIRMADGSDRLITRLRQGEFVFNPVTGRPSKIVKLTIGPEDKPLIHVTVGDSMVRVTDTHPFMTPAGWVMAKSLRKGEKILSAGREWRPVTQIEPGAKGRVVVNLALEGDASQPDLHYVLADGVVTGDLVIQNMISTRAALPNSTGR